MYKRQDQRSTEVACHDVGLYEALWSLTMFIVLTVIDRTQNWRDGMQVLLFGLAYGPVRFMLDTLRPESTDPTYGSLTPGQYGAALFGALCLVGLVVRSRSDA